MTASFLDVFPSPTSESAKQGGPQLNTTDDTSHENSVKAVQSVAMDDDQISSNTTVIRSTTNVPSTTDVPSTTGVPSTTDTPSTTVNDEVESSDLAASKDVKSHVLGNIQINSSNLEKRSDEVNIVKQMVCGQPLPFLNLKGLIANHN